MALPACRSVLAVCAHPDDESFGLGAALAALVDRGSSASVLCFTHGEASTLGEDRKLDLGAVRQNELARAADVLGVSAVRLLDYPDGALGQLPPDELAAHVVRSANESGADLLLVFDTGGITGHPDHVAATEAALMGAMKMRLPVLAWALAGSVAETLARSVAAGFVGRAPRELDFEVAVNRAKQLRAIACHETQAFGNPVLTRRLELQGDREVFRWLNRP